MPSPKNRPIKRRAISAINDGDRFLNNLRYLKDVFAPSHPEYLPLLDAIAKMIVMAQVSMGDFYEQAWGKKPPNYPGSCSSHSR